MKDFLNDENTTPQELEPEKQDAAKVSYEENDNWEFEARALTLEDTVIDNGNMEITIPKDKPKTYTAPEKKASTPKPAAKKSGNTGKFIVTGILTAVIIGVLVWLGIVYYTVPNTDEKMNPGNVAITVGDTDVSIGMYNYYYTCIYNNYLQYAQYGYYNIDPSTDFSKQETTDAEGNKTTWAKVFVDDAVEQIKYITAHYEAAIADGMTLTDEQKETIDNQLDSLKTTASESDMSVDDYISQTYGDYCGYATLKKMLIQCYVAENYFHKNSVESRVSQEDVNTYFDEHKDDYSEVSFAYLQMAYDSEDEKSKTETETQAAQYAKEISSVKDMKKLLPEACKNMIEEYVDAGYFESADEAAETLSENIETSITRSDTSFTEKGMEWLFSDDTKVGDCSSFTDTENSIVYIVLKTSDITMDEEDVYSVRHILVMPKSDEEKEDTEDTESDEKEFTEKQWAEAKTKADEILAEFNSGDKSEYSFALLAEKYTDDTESTSNGSSGLYGGLYAGTPLGQMVPNFENWSIDDSRQYGDVDIIESDYGYHIMFFVEKTKSYLYNCETELQSEREGEFVDEYPFTLHKSGMAKTKVAQPQASAGSAYDDDSDNMDY